jgi:hypothetical protein
METLTVSDARPTFDYKRHLNQLVRYGHNFIRLWRWEFTTRGGHYPCTKAVDVFPHPWPRTGPGLAPDGLPKFDLTQFNEDYFARLRARVLAAKRRGIFVSVMLFEGWGAQFLPRDWRNHPFQRANNVNGIDGDFDDDGYGHELYTLRAPAVNAIQDDYVRKVIDTVGDLDNVLYEIANESGSYSTAWQLRLIDLIRDYERRRGFRHPVGMTFQHEGGTNETLWRSNADWVSPRWVVSKWHFRYPLPSGRKVVLSDTDHHCGVCGDEVYVWKTFTRGHNVLLMDPLDKADVRERARRAMGHARRLADRLDLVRMRPYRLLSSTRYTLARPGYEYVTYQPADRPFTVDLRRAPRRLRVEWIHPINGRIIRGRSLVGGAVRRFEAPFRGQAVLYLAAE